MATTIRKPTSFRHRADLLEPNDTTKAAITEALSGHNPNKVYDNADDMFNDILHEECLEYNGYKGSIEYSKEDNCYFGKVQGLSKDLITYEGQTLDELRKDFEEAIDFYLEGCKADGVEPA